MIKRLRISREELKAIILSHGWFALKPFTTMLNPPFLRVAFANPEVGSGSFEIRSADKSTSLHIIRGTSAKCTDVARHCLSLDTKIEPFYEIISKAGDEWEWIINRSMGRFLRSVTLYEDCCKAILSTNTTWQRTIMMVNTLVKSYGKRIGADKAFPTPDKILSVGEKGLRTRVGCGFRAGYLLHLAETALLQKDVFLRSKWKEFAIEEFSNTLFSIKGLGPVSVNYISLLYWKPNGFNIDAYVIRRCKELWGLSSYEIPSFFKKRYKAFGEYAPLVMWFEITKHWHEKIITNNAQL